MVGRISGWIAHPGKAFVVGWASTAAAALATGFVIDWMDRPTGEDGLQGVGAIATFLFGMAGILILGPIIGLVCALVAWQRRRSRWY